MSTTSWDLAALQARIRSNEQAPEKLIDQVRSISRSTDIFRFHLYNARDALSGLIDETNPGSMENMLLVFQGSEDPDELGNAKIASEAHLIGTFHAARSMVDIFSHLINGLLLGNRFTVRDCDIKKVRDALPPSPLKNQLVALMDSHWFKYVSAFLNTTKHRNLVNHNMSASFVENKVGVQIGAFEYNGESYKPYWVREALEGVVGVKNAIVDLGRTLNVQYITSA